MKDKNASSVLRSFLAAIMVIVMAFSMSTFVFADEVDLASGETTGAETENAGEGASSTENVTLDSSEASDVSVVGFYRDGRYVDYYNEHIDADVEMPGFTVDATNVVASTASHEVKETYEGCDRVIVTTGNGELTYKINVEKTGMYAIALKYFPLLGDGNGGIH